MTAGQRLEAMERAHSARRDRVSEVVRIREEIVHTRAEMGKTISALQERLSPTALADQAKHAIRDRTIGRVEMMASAAETRIITTSQTLTETIRRHPYSAAIAGASLLWLFFHRERRPIVVAQRPAGTLPREALRAPSEKAPEVEEAAHAVPEAAERAGEALMHAEQKAEHAARQLARRARDRGVLLEHRAEEVYFQNPLAVGATLLAAGTAIGLAIPITRKENEWMGKTRDEIVDKISHAAEEAISQAEEAALGAEAKPAHHPPPSA